jgi:hypothetical protein
MHEYALKCVWEKTTPLSGKNNTYPIEVAVASAVEAADANTKAALVAAIELAKAEALAQASQAAQAAQAAAASHAVGSAHAAKGCHKKVGAHECSYDM